MQMTNNPQIQLPKYRSHKEVWALKIASYSFSSSAEHAHLKLNFENEAYAAMEITGEEAERIHKALYNEEEGTVDDTGYLVVYKDGYRSWSPTKAFEEGYNLIEN